MAFEITKVRPGQDLKEIAAIRQEIFGFGEDDLDEIGISILLKDEGIPVACGRIVLDAEADRVIIEQIGVIEGRRRQHIGTEVLNRLMDIARDCEADEVWAKTRMDEVAEGMLEKHGFELMSAYWMTVEMEQYTE